MNGFVILTDVGKVLPIDEYNQRLIKNMEKEIKGQNIRQWVVGLMEKSTQTIIDEELARMP